MINSDSTEGRGHMVCIGRYENEQQAYEHIKGKGVMGVGDGDVELVQYFKTDDGFDKVTTKVYGYRKDWNDNWGTGWLDWRDMPDDDPEFAEYIRLKKKFNK